MTHINPSTIADLMRDSLAKGQNPQLTVTSNSMAPLFWADDQVILEAIQPDQLNPGDIITLVDQTGLLTHRIWARRDNSFITRGDHALNFDDICQLEAVLGRVVGRVHKQHTLLFRDGWGRWLDGYLARLARQEHRWLTGSQENSTEVEPVIINTRIKVVHRLFFSWAMFISFAVNLATRVKSGENKI
jgi:hypothetical protein